VSFLSGLSLVSLCELSGESAGGRRPGSKSGGRVENYGRPAAAIERRARRAELRTAGRPRRPRLLRSVGSISNRRPAAAAFAKQRGRPTGRWMDQRKRDVRAHVARDHPPARGPRLPQLRRRFTTNVLLRSETRPFESRALTPPGDFAAELRLSRVRARHACACSAHPTRNMNGLHPGLQPSFFAMDRRRGRYRIEKKVPPAT